MPTADYDSKIWNEARTMLEVGAGKPSWLSAARKSPADVLKTVRRHVCS